MNGQQASHAEQRLIGAVLLDNAVWDRVADRVSEADFSLDAHRLIWNAISERAGRGDAFDPFVLAVEIERRGALERLPGGMSYIGGILDTTASAANAGHYARIVREQSVLRQLVAACTDISDAAMSGQGEPSSVLEMASGRIGAIADQSQRGTGLMDMPVLTRDLVEYLVAACDSGGKLLGVPTGFADLDALTSGLVPGELAILAGRPSMGKTSLAMNIAEHAALTDKRPVLVFSLEMAARQLMLRLTASLGRIPLKGLRHGDLREDEWSRVTNATMRLSQTALKIDDAADLSVSDITARARKVHRESGGVALIVVDYLQLIATRGKVENRNLEVAKISQGLKALAKSLNVPVLALSQLSRAVEQRPNKRPMMSDLRDSGGIEQDADLIAFIYRDEVYNPESADKGTAEVIVAKQRQGETGLVRLMFNGGFCRFENLARDWEPAAKPEPARSGRKPSFEY